MPKRGLPETLRMRHDEHYVESLAASAGQPVGRVVPIDLLDPNPNQPRQVMGDLSELMASVAEKGIIEPLIVRQLGGRYQIQGNAGGTVLACEPPRRLELTWEAMGAISWVDLTLAKEGMGARLTLEHAAPHPNPHWSTYGAGATGVGWDGAIMGLALHLATGKAVDPAEAMAWMTSDNGRAFYRASSEEWRRAAIAGGESEAEAGARATATTAFYTGGVG